MRIAICDDEKLIADELEKKIYGLQTTISNDNISIHYFSTPSSLLDYMLNLNSSHPFDIIFMDLEFNNPNEDGIMWCKKIMQRYPDSFVIILTAYTERYKEGYVARAFRFMTKPICDEELVNYLNACKEELNLIQTISLNRRGIQHKIYIKDILYLSAQSGGSELWTTNNVYYCEESLLQWEQRLPSSGFFRCHKKYLVNLDHVMNLDNHTITLHNKEKLPVSRRKWTALQSAYMKYDVGH